MKIKFIILLSILAQIVLGQDYIDFQQNRIDELDGERDQFLRMIDLNARNSATYTFITLIDDIQDAVNNASNISSENKEIIFKALEKDLKKVDENRLTKADREEKHYKFILNWVNEFKNENIRQFFSTNRDESFNIINYIYPFPETGEFLSKLPNNYIDQLLYKFPEYEDASYSISLLEDLIIKAPLTSKKYFTKNGSVFNNMRMSNTVAVNKILTIKEQLPEHTKAYVLLDDIVYNNLSLHKADEIGNNNKQYFKKLLKIRSKADPLAELSVDRELNEEALQQVREVNQLHEAIDPEVRFAITKDLTAAEMYTLIVYSEDEIFTSSFNGIYERFVAKMKAEKISGFKLLEQVGFNHFRTFIKMISYYGKLNTFLKTMKSVEKDFVLREFVSGITKSKHKLVDAVSIVNAISAIEDRKILTVFEEEIYNINTLSDIDSDSRLIYGLLAKMFNPKVQTNYIFFNNISNLYFTPPIDKIEISALLGIDGKNVQKHFFYDDEDGVASFSSFKTSFDNENWMLIEEKEYIKIVSTNNRVKIYANKPEFDETAWYYADKEMEGNREVAEIIIHRGHSYYVEESIEKIPSSAKLIVLGSCGGYNRLSQLLSKSDNAQIISTKQIGSMGVNNPLIYQMAEKARTGQDLNWSMYWNELKEYFKGRGKSEERFNDYVPPHKNLGAKFIAAYNMYSWVN